MRERGKFKGVLGARAYFGICVFVYDFHLYRGGGDRTDRCAAEDGLFVGVMRVV